jgi:hypothetical protein
MGEFPFCFITLIISDKSIKTYQTLEIRVKYNDCNDFHLVFRAGGFVETDQIFPWFLGHHFSAELVPAACQPGGSAFITDCLCQYPDDFDTREWWGWHAHAGPNPARRY